MGILLMNSADNKKANLKLSELSVYQAPCDHDTKGLSAIDTLKECNNLSVDKASFGQSCYDINDMWSNRTTHVCAWTVEKSCDCQDIGLFQNWETAADADDCPLTNFKNKEHTSDQFKFTEDQCKSCYTEGQTEAGIFERLRYYKNNPRCHLWLLWELSGLEYEDHDNGLTDGHYDKIKEWDSDYLTFMKDY